jgi:hypothetical protein
MLEYNSPLALCCRVPFILCCQIFLSGVGQCAFLFSCYSSYDLMLTLWLYSGLRVCDVLFSCSFLPVAFLYVESVLSARMVAWNTPELYQNCV